MDRSVVITLVAETLTQDENGVWKRELTEKEVFAQIETVTRAEFFEGGRNGLNPEFKFTMFFGDYDDEREVIYNGTHYGIYRVYYGRNDTIELYAERKGGLNENAEPRSISQ